ncbi:MAG TPA: hypothetical protein VM819_06240 [Vicinamibacterales bacterium]|nr:hypothetical protein [Vicinamibacterales bacterium]
MTAQDSLEVAALPEFRAEDSLPVERRTLLEDPDEFRQPGRRVGSFHEQVEVVRHEAVRNNCHAFVVGGLQKLRQDDIGGYARYEDTRPLLRANRQEISMASGVVESPEAWYGFPAHTR